MRILITGAALLGIWCFVSAWLYNDKLMPAIKNPVKVQAIPEVLTHEADSIMKIKESMPKSLLIYFDFDKAKFNPDPQSDNSVSAFRTWLEKYPQSALVVTGHADIIGTAEYNNDLSLKRAQTVEKYLETLGINSGRMIIESRGETEPIADYLTPEGRSKNRRTEVSLKMQ
ncbi:MAG: OmpA family protein [Bacteroidales bacterium]|nr:OmpA family protein [Bacteroidales bacterium]